VEWSAAGAAKLAAHFGAGDEVSAWLATARDGAAGHLPRGNGRDTVSSEKRAGQGAGRADWPVLGMVTRVNIPNPYVVQVEVNGRREFLGVKPEWKALLVPGMVVGMRPSGVPGKWVTRKPTRAGKW
jgi:hypothetical protein